VRSCRARGGLRTGPDRWRLKKPSIDKGGYPKVGLARGNRTYNRNIHRLMLEAFVGPCPEGHEACHNNGIRHDNRLKNLRWDTRKANSADRVAHGTAFLGATAPSAKLTEEKVLEIRDMRAAGHTYPKIAARFGVGESTARHIVSRETWRHV
jgi:hypothetical protein